MIRLRALALWWWVGLAALPACAGYRDLARDLDDYQPSSFYRSNVTPRTSEATRNPPVQDEFQEQIQALQEAKTGWEEALEIERAPGAFFSPEPGLVQALQGAAGDGAKAAETLAVGFDLEHLATLALLRNRGVRAAADNLRAALQQYNQAWNLDEILRQYSAFTEGLMTGVGPMKGREMTEMKFPFPGMLALKGEIVNQEVKGAREGLEIARRMAVTAARKTYWNLLFVHRAQGITREMVDLLQRLESVASSRYESGKTSFQDVIKVRINRETLQEELQTLGEKQRNLEARVREVLDLPGGTAVGAPAPRATDQSVPELDALYRAALERKQELNRMRAMVGKMERMIEMVESRTYPDYTLNLSLYQDEAINQVGTARMKEPFSTTTTASRGAGLPKMPWYGTNDAYLGETRQKLEALRQRLKDDENKTLVEVREAWFRLDQAAREERLFARSIVDLSQAALEVSTRGYETGRVMFADVIGSYTSRLKAGLTLERKRADLGVARAELEAAVGMRIED